MSSCVVAVIVAAFLTALAAELGVFAELLPDARAELRCALW